MIGCPALLSRALLCGAHQSAARVLDVDRPQLLGGARTYDSCRAPRNITKRQG